MATPAVNIQNAAFRKRRDELEIERFIQRRARRRDAKARRAQGGGNFNDDAGDDADADDRDADDRDDHDHDANEDARAQASAARRRQRAAAAAVRAAEETAAAAARAAAAASQRGRLAAYCVADEIRIIALQRHLDALSKRPLPARRTTIAVARSFQSNVSDYNPFEGVQGEPPIRLEMTPTQRHAFPTLSSSTTTAGSHTGTHALSGVHGLGAGPRADAVFGAAYALRTHGKHAQTGFAVPSAVSTAGVTDVDATPVPSGLSVALVHGGLVAPVALAAAAAAAAQFQARSFVSPGVDLYALDDYSPASSLPPPTKRAPPSTQHAHRQLREAHSFDSRDGDGDSAFHNPSSGAVACDFFFCVWH